MNVLFSNEGWEDYQYWQANDIKLLKKINDIIKDIKRNSNQGIGQPEKLKERKFFECSIDQQFFSLI